MGCSPPGFSIHGIFQAKVLFVKLLTCAKQMHGLPWWLSGKSICLQSRRCGFDPWVGKISWRSKLNPLPYSCLENPMDKGPWWAAVHGVTKSQTRLSDFTFTFHFHALEKEMAAHSSVLAWRIPGAGEPGGLPSMGSHRVGHD